MVNLQFLSAAAASDGWLRLHDRNHLRSRLGRSGSWGGGGSLRLEEAAEQGADHHHEQTYRGGRDQGILAGGERGKRPAL